MRPSLTIILAALTLSAAAYAGDDEAVMRMSDAGRKLEPYVAIVAAAARGDTKIRVPKSPDDCVADVENAAKTLRKRELFRSYKFSDHPRAKPGDYGHGLTLSDALEVCEDYRKLYPRLRVPFRLEEYEAMVERIRDLDAETAYSMDVVEDVERNGDPAGCTEVVAAARAIDPTMKAGGSGRSLDEYTTAVCDVLAVETPKWVATARAGVTKREEARRAPYIAVGVSGDKLELLAKYHGGLYWTLRGGKTTDDPTVLAKTNVLFKHALGDDPADPRFEINTVTKHTFKGNKLVKRDVKDYRVPKGTEAKASWFK